MSQAKSLYPFVSKLYTLVSDAQNAAYVSWSDAGDSFTVWNPSEFSTNVLPRYFKHNNYCSFIRQLNIYGFHKIDTENWVFKHEEGAFQRGNLELLGKISRRKQQKRAAPSEEALHANGGKSFKGSQDSLPSTPISPPSPLTTANSSPGSASSPPYGSPHDKSMADEVAYLKSVNEYVMSEVSGLKRKTHTQDNTISWLIQELLKSKKEMEEVKRTVKKLSADADDEKRRQALDMVGLTQNVPPLTGIPQHLMMQSQHMPQQSHFNSLLSSSPNTGNNSNFQLPPQIAQQQQQHQLHQKSNDFESVYQQQLHNLLNDDPTSTQSTPFAHFQGTPGFNPAAQDPTLKMHMQQQQQQQQQHANHNVHMIGSEFGDYEGFGM